jgi:hypothetical protein
MANRSSFPLLYYINFKNNVGYEGLLRTIGRDQWLEYKFKPQLDSIPTKFWGFDKASDIFKVEQEYKRRAYFEAGLDERLFNRGVFYTINTTLKRDLEIFVAVTGLCIRFYKTAAMAPMFFGTLYELFGRRFFFPHLRRLCEFVIYEDKRQKYFLHSQIQVLDKQLALARPVLDFFHSRLEKPDLYFVLKDLFDRLSQVSSDYSKIYSFKGNEDPRIVYSTFRCIIVHYSDVVRLTVLHLDVDSYRRIAR